MVLNLNNNFLFYVCYHNKRKDIHNFKKIMKYSIKNKYKNIVRKKDKRLVSVYHLK